MTAFMQTVFPSDTDYWCQVTKEFHRAMPNGPREQLCTKCRTPVTADSQAGRWKQAEYRILEDQDLW